MEHLESAALTLAGRFEVASGEELRALKREFRSAQKRVTQLYEAELGAVAHQIHDPHRAVLLEPGLRFSIVTGVDGG